jgi:hypothetical protein
MKRQPPLQIVLTSTALVLLGACAMFQKPAQPALVGNWTNSLGTVWTIKGDGTFDVDLKHQGQRDAWGTYMVAGDQVTMQRIGGINPKGCDGPGVYKFSRPNKDSLQFALVSDACKLRKKNVLLTWHRK